VREDNKSFVLFRLMCEVSEDAEHLNFIAKLVTIYIYIYIYMCVCVCVCVSISQVRILSSIQLFLIFESFPFLKHYLGKQ
jgi:hypothetical protein